MPNLTIGPMVCNALRNHGVTKDIDVHLMVEPVDAMIADFATAGASYITFHPQASKHVDRSLSLIRSFGCKSGLVLTPSSSLDHCKYLLDKIDIILLMSVNPGFGGQSFIPSTIRVSIQNYHTCVKLNNIRTLPPRLTMFYTRNHEFFFFRNCKKPAR